MSDITVPARGLGGRSAIPLPRGCTRHTRACFSVSSGTAWLISPSGVILRVAPALGGRPGHRTPQGRFRVDLKDEHHYSGSYRTAAGLPAPMPFYVRFAPLVGFHAGSLSVMSHGCVHLSRADAVAFYRALRIGDEVVVAP